MIKKILCIVIVLLLSVGSVFAQGFYSHSSGEKTSDTVITAKGGYITALQIITDGTNDGKVILYDNASAASGKVITEVTVSGDSHYGGRVWVHPANFANGIYADVTGTGASFIVEFFSD